MTSSSLQQSLIQSIQDSKNRSRNSNSCLLSESFNSQSQSNLTQLVDSKALLHSFNPDHNSQWISFCDQLKSDFSHYFFEVQSHLHTIRQLLHDKQIKQIQTLTLTILSTPLKDVVTHQYLYLAFSRQASNFLNEVSKHLISVGITDARAAISEVDQLAMEDSFNVLQEVYSMMAMTHLFMQSTEAEFSDEDLDIECSSISSDFSDEVRDIEDFECETAYNLMESIKKQLQDEDVFEACKKYHFTLNDGQLDLQEFFIETLQFQQINEYEIQCFLYNSGLFLKTLRGRALRIEDALKLFITNFQQVMNRVIDTPKLRLWILENDFSGECVQVSKRAFYSRKNLLRSQFYQVLQTKLTKWRDLNLTTQEMNEQFNSELSYSSDKRYLRKLTQRWSIPVNKFEIKVIAWDKCSIFTEKTVRTMPSKLVSQDMILRMYPSMDEFWEHFVEKDTMQTGYIEFKEFVSALRNAAIPISAKEALKMFKQHEEVKGQVTSKGVVVKRCVEYQSFIWKMYGIEHQPKSQEFGNLSFGEKTPSQISERKPSLPDRLMNKYSPDQTNLLMIKNLAHKNRELLENQVDNIRQFVAQYQYQQRANDELKQEVARLSEEIRVMSESETRTLHKIDEVKQLKELENIENLQQFSNLNEGVLGRYKIKERQWMQERNHLLRQLEVKDRQMDHYRIELEGLIAELRHVKTLRTNEAINSQ